MFSPKADAPLNVHVPGPAEDRPSWMKVGVITAIGFIAGIAWPRVAGVRLGPSVPETSSSAVASAAPESPSPAAPSQPAAVSAAAPVVVSAPAVAEPSAAAAAPAGSSVVLSVGHGAVFACKTAEGEPLKGSACGTLPGFDSLVMPRLRKLADCPEAAGASGTLHLIVHPDFGRGSVGVELGRGQGVSSAEALLACAKSDVASASLTGVAHDNPRYSVSYRVSFGAGGAALAASGATASARGETAPAPSHGQRAADDVAADGEVQVAWEVAVVRDAPKTGKVLARLPRGSTVRVGPIKDGWYPVKYGDGFSAEGWVYRGALGK
jgi:hypothetical protein